MNNAGTSKFARHSDLEALSGDYLAIYETNVVEAYQMIRAVTPAMKRSRWGAVVNVASMQASPVSGHPPRAQARRAPRSP